jgi:hypothetical protein
MIQCGRHLRFALKPLSGSGVRELRGYKFDRCRPVELRIGGAIHDTHAADSEHGIDTINTHHTCAVSGRTDMSDRSGLPRQERFDALLQLEVTGGMLRDERRTF